MNITIALAINGFTVNLFEQSAPGDMYRPPEIYVFKTIEEVNVFITEQLTELNPQ